jgi:hypothetical protein
MASIKPTVLDVSMKGDGSAMLYTWTPVTEADTCAAAQLPQFNDKSIHVSGTFGGSSTAVQGSNSITGATFAALHSPDSVAIALTADSIKAVLENTYLIKPVPTGGSSQSLTINLLARLSNPLRQ